MARSELTPLAKSVMDVLAASECHLTADEVHSELEGVSPATVYRALENLSEKGKIRRLSLGGRSVVYEYARPQHLHFVCTSCSRIYDIPVDLSAMTAEMVRIYGHRQQTAEMTVHGICCDCGSQKY